MPKKAKPPAPKEKKGKTIPLESSQIEMTAIAAQMTAPINERKRIPPLKGHGTHPRERANVD
jgi:hypothetical protein